MAEAGNSSTVTPPATSGGLTLDQVNDAISKVLAPITKSLGDLAENQRVLASTMEKLPPAKQADTKEKPEPLTPESIAKIVQDTLAADRKAQNDQVAKAAAIKTAKEKVIADKLGGDAELGGFLPDTDDAAQLTAAAEKLAVKVTPKAKVPGVSADGGTASARQPVDTSKLNASQKVQLGIDQMIAQAGAKA